MTESRANVESNDMMVRITALDRAQQNGEIEYASRLARRRSRSPRMGILGRLLGCLPHVAPIFLSSYRRKKKKLISDPRLRHILDQLIISLIRKVEEAGPSEPSESSNTNLTPMKKTVKSLNQSIPQEKGSTFKNLDLVQECSLTDNEDEADDEADNETDETIEDLNKLDDIPKKEKEIIGGGMDCVPVKLIEEHPNAVIPDSKDSTSSPKKETQPKPKNILENRECPICWEPYQVGQQICWSPNKRCTHAFHADCMILWLMKKDDCPMCRSNYLLVDH